MKIDLHYFFVPKYAKWIITVLVITFTLLLLLELSYLFRSYRFSEEPNLEVKPLTVAKVDNSSFLLNSSLFGVYVPVDLNEGSVKKSALDVSLVGILLAIPIEESEVIIRTANGDENTFLLGDTIPGGAVIKRITASGVLVERGGVLESLSLPKDDLTFEPVPEPLKQE